ncbi:MAG: hypothetical protein QW413_04505 [Nitrososphaerota archaeon]
MRVVTSKGRKTKAVSLVRTIKRGNKSNKIFIDLFLYLKRINNNAVFNNAVRAST